MTDASPRAVGAVLQQYIDSQWCPIAYFSKKLKPAETKYSTFDGTFGSILINQAFSPLH